MKIRLLLTVFVSMAVGVFFIKGPAEALDITKTIEGTFKETQGNSFKIVEEADSKEVQVAVDSNTVYNNVQKLTDFKAGDKVQVDYYKKGQNNTAITVTKLEVEH